MKLNVQFVPRKNKACKKREFCPLAENESWNRFLLNQGKLKLKKNRSQKLCVYFQPYPSMVLTSKVKILVSEIRLRMKQQSLAFFSYHNHTQCPLPGLHLIPIIESSLQRTVLVLPHL